MVSDIPTIIFGADVTHPETGEDSSPSIAAVMINHLFSSLGSVCIIMLIVIPLSIFSLTICVYRWLLPKTGLKLQNMLDLYVLKLIDKNSFRTCLKHGMILSGAQLQEA